MKKFLVLILISCMCLLTGCGQSSEITVSQKNSGMFVCIQPADGRHNYDIVYHKDTKVMYVISHDTYNRGNFTLLVNPDGTPMIYEDETEGE